MGTHWFTLTLAEPIADDYPDHALGNAQIDEIAGKLLATGCADATIHGQGETVYVSFAREADSLEEAIRSARQAVERAGLTVSKVELEPEPA
jgi:hypothetical protein